jgi:hypothetical protein
MVRRIIRPASYVVSSSESLILVLCGNFSISQLITVRLLVISFNGGGTSLRLFIAWRLQLSTLSNSDHVESMGPPKRCKITRDLENAIGANCIFETRRKTGRNQSISLGLMAEYYPVCGLHIALH